MLALSFGYSNLTGHIYAYPDDTVSLQSHNGNTIKRLQLQVVDDTIQYFISRDNGATWPVVEQIITSNKLVLSGVDGVDLFYDITIDTAVIKWRVTKTNHYQLCINSAGLAFDHWDGTQWTRIWTK